MRPRDHHAEDGAVGADARQAEMLGGGVIHGKAKFDFRRRALALAEIHEMPHRLFGCGRNLPIQQPQLRDKAIGAGHLTRRPMLHRSRFDLEKAGRFIRGETAAIAEQGKRRCHVATLAKEMGTARAGSF